MRTRLLLFFFICIAFLAKGQLDSLWQESLEETVVTATRSDRKWSQLPMPVMVIKKEQIQQMGSLRLNDVLAEQTGLVLVNDHGSGVQVQGFDPDYTLILVDGEPIIGRTSGTLDLSRLAVGNIKQIEVVKGPSSSLYGSEALAGVINIITDKPDGTSANGSIRYGTNQTSDISFGGQFRKGNVSGGLFANRFGSNGYDLSPETIGATVSPFQNYAVQPKLNLAFSPRFNLLLNTRFSNEVQEARTNVGTLVNPDVVSGQSTLQDFNFNPTLTAKFSNKIQLTGRYYITHYNTTNVLNREEDNTLFDETFFRQSFQRPELQADFTLSQNQFLIAGIGRIQESVEATRYDGTKRFSTTYAFLQHEFFLQTKTQLITGLRYDAHSAYRNQLSPKLSISHEVSKAFTLRASSGLGYKAPDFRQLFLNFTNSVAGYSVFGSQEVNVRLAELQQSNQILGLLLDTSEFGDLAPESSFALNLGAKYKHSSGVLASVNFFRNDIRNLIETQPVAIKTNGQQVFSYQNLNRVFTQGMELDVNKNVNLRKSTLNVAFGYQLLDAKDKNVVEALKEGNVFRRNAETLETERVARGDYFGLLGRSRHSANLKFFFSTENGFHATFRTVYRGKYGFGDSNGNGIADVAEEFISGYLLVNTSIGYDYKGIGFQAGIDNLGNFINPQFIPGIPGRLFWITLRYQLKNQAR